jgi:class 3 adenylate cyclase
LADGLAPLRDLLVFLTVTGTIVSVTFFIGTRLFLPLETWMVRSVPARSRRRVPEQIRRRALNRPLLNALFSMAGWTTAGLFYVPYQLWVGGAGLEETLRVFTGIVLVAGPLASALAFLVAEFYSRRSIPLFFPYGGLARVGVVRVPILVRLGATFFVTSVLPPLLMVMVSFSLVDRYGGELPEELRPLWTSSSAPRRTSSGRPGVVSVVMALLVARFINRPVQASAARRWGASRAATSPCAPGAQHGRARRAERALQRDGARAPAGRTDARALRPLRERGRRAPGARARRRARRRAHDRDRDVRRPPRLHRPHAADTPAARVVELLNEYYGIVEHVCETEGGIITQFLGDGVVVVFGGPLHPLRDHARHAVRAAVALQRALAERNARGGESLVAGIGICTGDMIAGNVGSTDRVTYTIVGDAVNQAARLQVKTRDLGHPILLTESTRVALGGPNGFALHPCGPVALRDCGAGRGLRDRRVSGQPAGGADRASTR